MLQGHEFLEHLMYFYFSGISTANFDTSSNILQKNVGQMYLWRERAYSPAQCWEPWLAAQHPPGIGTSPIHWADFSSGY